MNFFFPKLSYRNTNDFGDYANYLVDGMLEYKTETITINKVDELTNESITAKGYIDLKTDGGGYYLKNNPDGKDYYLTTGDKEKDKEYFSPLLYNNTDANGRYTWNYYAVEGIFNTKTGTITVTNHYETNYTYRNWVDYVF